MPRFVYFVILERNSHTFFDSKLQRITFQPTRVLVRGTLHRCAKAGACSRRFSRPSCCARGNTCKRRTGPPQNMWCFSVLFCVGTCKSEIAQTGRQRISQDGIGRSHQDLAIRSLGRRVNSAFAQITAVDGGAKSATHKSGTGSGVA